MIDLVVLQNYLWHSIIESAPTNFNIFQSSGKKDKVRDANQDSFFMATFINYWKIFYVCFVLSYTLSPSDLPNVFKYFNFYVQRGWYSEQVIRRDSKYFQFNPIFLSLIPFKSYRELSLLFLILNLLNCVTNGTSMINCFHCSFSDPDKPEGYDEPHSQQTRISKWASWKRRFISVQ